MDELISIIVPIYNVEKHLKKCIESIINQTYKKLEIILIDDGSTDSSSLICDNFKKQDSRINVIHQKNSGISIARNNGISISHGKYISFVDSDDYIDDNFIEFLYNNLKENDSDISVCDYVLEYDNEIKNNKYSNYNFISKNKNKFNNLYNEYQVVTVVSWNKLYKKELFDNIKFSENRIFEDEIIIIDLLDKVYKISYNLKPLYHYYQRDNSVMHKFNLNKVNIINILDDRIKFLEEKKYNDLVIQEKCRRIYISLKYLALMKKNKCYVKLVEKQIISLNIKYSKDILKNKKVPFKIKMKIRLFLLLKNKMIYLFLVK